MMSMELFSTQDSFDLFKGDHGVGVEDEAGEIPSWLTSMVLPQIPPSLTTALAILTVATVVVAMLRLALKLELKVKLSSRKTVDANNLATFSSRSKVVEILRRFGAREAPVPKKRLSWHSSVRDYTR